MTMPLPDPLYRPSRFGRRRLRLADAVPLVVADGAVLWRLLGKDGHLWRWFSLDPERAKRLAAMRRIRPPAGIGLAWPHLPAIDRKGRIWGYVIQDLPAGAVPLEGLLRPAAPWPVRVRMAERLAARVAGFSAAGHGLGPLTLARLLYDPRHRDVVLLGPEDFGLRLEGKAWSARQPAPGYRPREETDDEEARTRFALAVCLFRILTGGFHPFADAAQAVDGEALQARIDTGAYAYGFPPDAGAATAGLALPVVLREMFERAFVTCDERPSAADWRDALAAALNPPSAAAPSPLVDLLKGSVAFGLLLIPSCLGPMLETAAEPGLLAIEGVPDAGTVRDLQEALAELGFDPGSVDGLWGLRTERALDAFHREAGFLLNASPAAMAAFVLDAAQGLRLAKNALPGHAKAAWLPGAGRGLAPLDLAALGKAAERLKDIRAGRPRVAWGSPLRPAHGWLAVEDEGRGCRTLRLTLWHEAAPDPLFGRVRLCPSVPPA